VGSPAIGEGIALTDDDPLLVDLIGGKGVGAAANFVLRLLEGREKLYKKVISLVPGTARSSD